MYKIIKKVQFSEKVFRLDVEAPLIAKARKAGHFVIIRVGEKGERVLSPLQEVTQRREPLRWLFKPLEQVPISFVL
jgi:NAD(P)H-flavin reductase